MKIEVNGNDYDLEKIMFRIFEKARLYEELAKSNVDKLLHCNFCGKSQREVFKLVSGPSVYICDECIKLCNEILIEHTPCESNGSGI